MKADENQINENSFADFPWSQDFTPNPKVYNQTFPFINFSFSGNEQLDKVKCAQM